MQIYSYSGNVQEGFFEQTNEFAWCSYIILTRHIEKVPEKFA